MLDQFRDVHRRSAAEIEPGNFMPTQDEGGPARGSNSRRPDERFPRNAGPITTLPV
jgi:hypothetical protein